MVGSLFAQNLPPQSDIEKMTATEKMMLYDKYKKSSIAAAGGWFLFPSFGHIYLEQYNKVWTFLGGQLLAFGVPMSLTLNNGGNTIWGTDPIGDEEFFITWIISAGIIRTWELVDVLISTNNYNKKLYQYIYSKNP